MQQGQEANRQARAARRAGKRPITTRTRGLRQVAEAPAIRRGRAVLRVRGAAAHALAYERMVAELKARYKISIRKWRQRMSGVAYELTYQDGRIKRLIAAPRPRSPVSAAIFLHEVGHHAIGFKRYAPRCLEELYVWQWVFREMAARRIPVDRRVHRHYYRSMYHYVKLARQHGHHVPHELNQFAQWAG